ncbi:MAG: PKD domain-containing protein [Bacteroidota bacterium]
MNLYKISNGFPLFAIFFALFVVAMGCNDDDDPTPTPKEAPTASFTFTADSDDPLTINFSSTSTEATSFSWDFGDGNTSTEENPSHTYDAPDTYTVELTVGNDVGSNSATASVTAESPFKTSGWVIGSTLPVTGSVTNYTDFYDELPSGDIDITQGQSAQVQYYAVSRGQFFYGRIRTPGEFGVAKFAIDASSGELVEVGRITTLDPQFATAIISDELGFSTGFGTLEVLAFNPSTMEIIQRIDLSVDTPLPPASDTNVRGVSGAYYNEMTGKLFLALNYNLITTNAFYDLPDVYAEVIDVNTLTRDGSIRHPEAFYPRMNAVDNSVVDAAGNLYIIAQGSYGLDGLLGPLAPDRARPQILKIDAQTNDFDVDYAWNPAAAAGFGNNLIQVFTSMVGTDSDIAYGLGVAAPDPPRLLQLIALFAQGMLDDAGFQELTDLVFTSENGQLYEINLADRTANVVPSAPLTAGYNYPYMYNYDGLIYHQVSSANYNGFYVTDPSNGNATSPVFNLTAGGFATSLIKIGGEK